MELDYVDLHLHTHFSFGDGTFSPTDMVNRAKDLGRKAIAVTEHGNVSSHAEFEKAAVKAGIKPIFGIEAYLVPNVEKQRAFGKSKDKEEKESARRRFHMTVLAQTQAGYSNLLSAVTESWRDNFYYHPLWDMQTLNRYGEGLVVTSGCLSGAIGQSLLAGDLQAAEDIALKFKAMFGENFYLETQLFDFEKTRLVNEGVLWLAKKIDVKPIVTNDVHQLVNENRPLRQLVHCIRDQRRWDEPASNDYNELTEYQLSPQEIVDFSQLASLGNYINQLADNTVEVAEKCNVEIPKSNFLKFPLPDGEEDANMYLYKLLKAGLSKRGISNQNKEYVDRLVYEMSVIESKGFVDYFLVVSDVVQWAKRNGIIVGPGRGSAAGSLVSYLLGITEVDPVRYGLMFERFIDVDRLDYPDIDLDFDSDRREEVREFFVDKYGADRVSLLGTFSQWKSKSSLDAIGRVYGIPIPVIAEAKSEIGKFTVNEDDEEDADEYDNELDVAFDKSPLMKELMVHYPTMNIASSLAGQMRGLGKHACGVILSERPLNEICAVYKYGGTGDPVTSVNGSGAEYLGLLKIDVLGVSALSVLKKCLEYTNMTVEEMYALPHDDPETYRGFNEGDSLGIFQIEGAATKAVLDRMPNIKSIIDLSHVISLCRPGPNDSGITDSFLSARAGMKKPNQIHPVIDEKLAWTYGEVVYQEQITQLAMIVGKMSGGRADTLRKAVAKKYGADFIEGMRAEFVSGALENGLDAALANHLFDQLLDFGRYAFNLSHSVAYSLVSYYMMWFKRHHPTAFYAASLAYTKEDEKTLAYLREFVSRGGKVLPPNYNKSGKTWKMERKNVIRAGFDAIPGIGETVSDYIVEYQPYESPEKFRDMRVKRPTDASPERMALIVNKTQFDSLLKAGAFDDAESDFMGLQAFCNAINMADWENKTSQILTGDAGDYVLAGAVSFREIFSQREQNSRYGRTGPIEHPEFDEYMRFTITDDTGYIPVTISRYVWPKFRALMLDRTIDGDIIQVTGFVNEGGNRRIIVKDIKPQMLKLESSYVFFEDKEILTSQDKEWRLNIIRQQKESPKLRRKNNVNQAVH